MAHNGREFNVLHALQDNKWKAARTVLMIALNATNIKPAVNWSAKQKAEIAIKGAHR